MKFLIISFICLFASISSIAQNNFHLRSELHEELGPFYHGVASGDPTSDAVIIWTRVTPDPLPLPNELVEVNWEIATDLNMLDVVNSGTAYTSDARDYTVKIDVNGLLPYTCYYYKFDYAGISSLTGRTKTAPIDDIDSLRFAVVSCSDYAAGYFNAYASIVERDDIDAVIHLGDYLYEYTAVAGVDGRTVEPENEIISLSDYRTRHSHYKLDEDLRKLHQQFPIISVWDDHESANDSWKGGAQNHNSSTEGLWENRKSSSKQAYFEWMPIRQNTEDSLRLYREIQYGDLLNLYMCDTRLEGRDEQVGATSSEINDTNRRLLGEDQYNWLLEGLQNSSSRWNILGQQVMMAPLEVFGLVLNPDQWDGYPAERNRFYGDILSNNINNLVVLTGDIHTSWANNLPGENYDASTGSGSMGVEFVITSVTSVGFPFSLPNEIITAANPHIQWSNLDQRGYLLLDVNKDRVQADWMLCESVFSSNTDVSRAKSYFVNDGETFLNEISEASERDDEACVQAPIFDEDLSVFEIPENNIIMLGVYPNPFEKEITIQYNSVGTDKVKLIISTLEGKEMSSFDFAPKKGLNYLKIDGQPLIKGSYILKIVDSGGVLSKKIIRL